ncbi:MAG: hypothetical protein ABS43_01725 [Bordetella sp. SCN 67-23]|nr:hypothetical protein [Burkholderiales bacterium]ODS76291.1 MAG: hypothetical protein ABS43_01725 [Bordetella sp. SCN 67-23]OJW90094.1 MAG: hypothetical protein BGO71_27660 [Burkholderiales bacterium 67-32]
MSGMRRDPRIQARLDAWGMWRQLGVQGGSFSGGGSTLAALVDVAAGRRVFGSSEPPRAYVPVDAIECAITHEAVQTLPAELREAVAGWHCARTGTMEEVARRLGVVKTTLHRRLCQADIRIAEWLKARTKAKRIS